ncbi:hypothetical protein L1987_14907 [Smallanthus sonchifolius]|uniref:Uncharacterized protein n=1 Tax=Smallanthus sonchifolius TaxID=185202 RepID=A0ACB9J693_9ASTR|nr:hypothetical protein L1987_14907 [Smallanthus sonchifolius]
MLIANWPFLQKCFKGYEFSNVLYIAIATSPPNSKKKDESSTTDDNTSEDIYDIHQRFPEFENEPITILEDGKSSKKTGTVTQTIVCIKNLRMRKEQKKKNEKTYLGGVGVGETELQKEKGSRYLRVATRDEREERLPLLVLDF